MPLLQKQSEIMIKSAMVVQGRHIACAGLSNEMIILCVCVSMCALCD